MRESLEEKLDVAFKNERDRQSEVEILTKLGSKIIGVG